MSVKKQNIAAASADEKAGYPIKVVARRTGVSPDVIRAWERRYGAVTPQRSSTNRRFYSDQDIQRLRLLNQAIGLGRRIGDVARLPLNKLVELVDEDRSALEQSPSPVNGGKKIPSETVAENDFKEFVETCIEAIERLNPTDLEAALARAAIACSVPLLLEKVICKVMYIVGQRWQEGKLRLVHEHMATATIHFFLGSLFMTANDNALPSFAPVLIVTTPDGQHHELGALMTALVASYKGWQPLYLGLSTPIDEIAFAATEKSAKAIALSICYPGDDPHLPTKLKKLYRQLPAGTTVIAGGASMDSYRAVLDDIGAVCLYDLGALQTKLDELRERQPA